MTFIDFHTHHVARGDDELAIIDGKDTWGIHPWNLSVSHPSVPGPGVLAIGECGIDKLCNTPLPQQEEAMMRCIKESEKLCKPLILHCVRGIDACVRLRKQAQAIQPWIWHGYRGNGTQLRQLLPMGFYFSFGFRFRVEALVACPPERLLLESDDDPRPVSVLYAIVAESLGVSLEDLCAQMSRNYKVLFGKTLL